MHPRVYAAAQNGRVVTTRPETALFEAALVASSLVLRRVEREDHLLPQPHLEPEIFQNIPAYSIGEHS